MALKASGMTSAETVMLMSAILLGSIRTLTVTPCVEVVAVWTVPGAVSPVCILAEPRKGDKLTPGGNESGGFGANKRKGNVGNVSCMNPSMLRQCGKSGAILRFV